MSKKTTKNTRERGRGKERSGDVVRGQTHVLFNDTRQPQSTNRSSRKGRGGRSRRHVDRDNNADQDQQVDRSRLLILLGLACLGGGVILTNPLNIINKIAEFPPTPAQQIAAAPQEAQEIIIVTATPQPIVQPTSIPTVDMNVEFSDHSNLDFQIRVVGPTSTEEDLYFLTPEERPILEGMQLLRPLLIPK